MTVRIAVCDDSHRDACAICELLEGQEVKLYDNAESLLVDVGQGGKRQGYGKVKDLSENE